MVTHKVSGGEDRQVKINCETEERGPEVKARGQSEDETEKYEPRAEGEELDEPGTEIPEVPAEQEQELKEDGLRYFAY